MEAVTIPVMAKARIGHFVECQVCQLHLRSPASPCGGGAMGRSAWRKKKKKKNNKTLTNSL
jgi:hypothetical protein